MVLRSNIDPLENKSILHPNPSNSLQCSGARQYWCFFTAGAYSIYQNNYRANVLQYGLSRSLARPSIPHPLALSFSPPHHSAVPPEFSFVANAPPVGGYVTSKQLAVSAGEDTVLLQSEAWIDDFDDLPMSHQFGLAYGRHEIISVSR